MLTRIHESPHGPQPWTASPPLCEARCCPGVGGSGSPDPRGPGAPPPLREACQCPGEGRLGSPDPQSLRCVCRAGARGHSLASPHLSSFGRKSQARGALGDASGHRSGPAAAGGEAEGASPAPPVGRGRAAGMCLRGSCIRRERVVCPSCAVLPAPCRCACGSLWVR